MNNIRGLVVGQRSVFNKLSKSNAFARLLSVKGKIYGSDPSVILPHLTP